MSTTAACVEVLLDRKITTEVAREFCAATSQPALGLARQVRLVIDCAGGGYSAGLAVVTQVRRLRAAGITVTAFVAGDCGSMAVFVAAAADRVVISRTGRFFVHGLSLTSFCGDLTDLRLRLGELERQVETVAEILHARVLAAGGRDPRLTDREQLIKLLSSRRDNFFGPDEAVVAGLADEVGEPAV